MVSLASDKYKKISSNVIRVEYVPFLFGSLFADTPRGEFSLLFDALNSENRTLNSRTVDKIIKIWGLKDIADYNFHQLSGGYRKYVLVATQVEARRRGECVVAINIQQQLDVVRFRTIEKRFAELGVKSVLWVDDNPGLLIHKARQQTTQTYLLNWMQYQVTPTKNLA